MEQLLTTIHSAATSLVVVFLAAGCLLYFGWCVCRCLSSVALWRLQRGTLAMLVAVAATATIVAQKDRGGGTETGVPPVAIPRAGTLPVANEVTNTLHFADIAVGTNTVTLAVAWSSGLFAVGTTIDLLATTSLVESVWGWRQAHDVAAGETNWTVTVEKERVSRFYKAVVRDSLADMDDFDGDGLPNVYELVNGTNPYVDDYASAPKLTVGPSGSYEAVEDAVSASEPYSIIEIDPSVTHEVTDYLGVEIPQHPLMVTAPHPYAIVRATGIAAFMLATNTTSQTLFRNLYLLLDAKDSFQAGFWCGGSVPMSGVPAAATFENIYVRMPNPEVQYRGWILYRKCADQVSLCGCTLNAAGATWAIGIDAFGSPPFEIDSCSFVNFPPDNASQTGCGVLLRTSNSSAGGSDVMISRTLFDESFTNAWPFARFDSNAPYMATMSSCLSPRPLPPDYPPDVVTNLVVTNATLTWSAIPYSSSSSVALGIGSLAPVENDPSVDTDGDELADYDEVYVHGSDPFLVDSDFDGVNDTVEIHEGTDPADPFSFWQRLTVTVTNTVSLACPVRVALGYSATGWETNGATAFASGFGETTYTNASSQGVAYVKAYCDLDGNGEYDADGDILLVRPIPYEGTAQIGFTFGDVDGDGVSDVQEREELTDPYDDKNFRMVVMVNVESSDVASGLTNFVAWGHSPVGWETNGLTAFAEASVAYPIDALATNGTLFVKVFRDFNADGVYDAGVDALASSRLTKKENGKTVTLRIGDSDNDRVPDSIERGEGTDPFDGRNYCFDMAVTVTRIFQTTNRLTLAATFGEATIYGPTMMTTNVWAMDFGHLATTNRENVVLTFWDDANSNGIHEVAETSVELVLYVTNHVNICSHRLSYGAFDANNDNVLDWWMIREGLVAEGVANRLYDDPDGDGLVNLHEFWSGTHPLIPDGSNTLLSVVARSIDDRIRDIDLATAIPRFVDYFANGPTNAFVVNTNFWAKDLDLSCVSVWHPGDNPGSKAATLVTRRHVVMAQHWFSNTYAFCDTNGLVCIRSILQAEHISDDLRLGRLNQPLPESFRPAKVLTADFDRYLASGRYLPTLCLNHEKGATIHELENLNCEVSEGLWRHYTQYGATSQTNLVSAQRCGVRGVTVDGNSGCPFFIVAENELILLFSKHLGWPQVMTWSPSSGPMLSFRLAAIQHKINEWEGDDADLYQIEQLDLSAYGEIVNP